ncbi:MAG: hypothetical protein ACO1OB_01720, partial [Archangium sp.]
MLVRAAEAAGDTARESLAWELSARGGAGAFGLRRAEATSTGVRRLVLARLHAEDELFRGEAAQAVKTAQAAFRLTGPAVSTHGPPAWKHVVLHDVADELERWDTLTVEEANLALELARAEALSHLGQAGETRRAFEGIEARL